MFKRYYIDSQIIVFSFTFNVSFLRLIEGVIGIPFLQPEMQTVKWPKLVNIDL